MVSAGRDHLRDDAPWTDDPAFAEVEAAHAAYLRAWGAWMVGHHRSAPLGEGTEASLAERLVAARTTLGTRLAGLDATALATADAAALDVLRRSLPDLDAWPEPLDGMTVADQAAGDLETDLLRRRTFDAWGAAMAGLEVDGRRSDRLTLIAELSREPDPARRRRLFLAMAPAWAAVDGAAGPDDPDGPFRRLVRASAERWRAHGSPIEANAAAVGLDPLVVEPTLRRMLATFRAVVGTESGLLEPWDYRFATGALARRLDDLVPVDRLRPLNDAHLRSIGADPRRLRIGYDLAPRPGRPVIPTAFTVALDVATRTAGRWRPARPWVFATYADGGIGNLEELLHESGHALHYAALRARPACFAWPGDHSAFVEAIADVVGWTTHEPTFLEASLGASVPVREAITGRYAGVMLDAAWTLFEIEIHRHPDRAPNDAWAEVAERDLGVAGHPEWSWWAQRGQLIDGPGYLANYALGAIVVAAVRHRLREVVGDWSTGNPRWYRVASRRLLRFAGAREPRDVLRGFLGGPLSAAPLLADLERAG